MLGAAPQPQQRRARGQPASLRQVGLARTFSAALGSSVFAGGSSVAILLCSLDRQTSVGKRTILLLSKRQNFGFEKMAKFASKLDFYSTKLRSPPRELSNAASIVI